jgi:hypothetical protein
MSEETFAEFLASLDARATEEDEAERELLAPPTPAKQIGSSTVSSLASELQKQVKGRHASTSDESEPVQETRPRFCSRCGTALKPEGRFCSKCGAPIKA